MLVNVDAGRKREVGTDADEHASELGVVEVEIELTDPTVLEIKVIAADFFLTD